MESLPHLSSFAVAVIIMKSFSPSEQRLCLIPPCGPICNYEVQSMTINCIQKQQSEGGKMHSNYGSLSKTGKILSSKPTK